MKKIIFLMALAIVGVATASAQFEAGGKTLSGRLTGLDFTYSSKDKSSIAMVDLSLAGSYFVANNFAVEALFGITAENRSYDGTSYYKDNAVQFGIGARYYVWNALFAGVGYQGHKIKDVDLINFLNVGVGYTYYITDNVFFEPTIVFNKMLEKDSPSTFCLQIGIGVNF